MGLMAGLLATLLVPAITHAQDTWSKERTQIEADVETLRKATALTGVVWGRCLLKGLERSRTEKKPVLLWALAGDPTGRC